MNGQPTLPEFLVQAYIENRGVLFWNWILETRGFSRRVIHEFELGYAPKRAMFDIWPVGLTNVPRKAREFGISIHENQYYIPGKMPLAGHRDDGASLTIPIRDSSGNLKGFSARYIGKARKSARDQSGARYKRWGELPVYGAYQFTRDALSSKRVILVEGYTDLWRIWETGIKDVLSIYGTSGLKSFLTKRGETGNEFKSLLSGKEVWLFMDGDVAGRDGALQQVVLLKKAMRSGFLDISGLYVVVGPAPWDPGDFGEPGKPVGIEEIGRILSEKPMGAEEYAEWWLSRGIDPSDPTQKRVLNARLEHLWNSE